MIFLQPLYQFFVNNYADKINHFPLIKLIFFSLDKTLFYFLIFAVARLIWLLSVSKRRKLMSELSVWIFAFYLMLLLSLTVFRDAYWPWDLQIYLNRPLSDINFKFLLETLKLTKGLTLLDFFYNFIGNVLWFIPFGLLWPMVRQKKAHFFQTIFSGILLSIMIESLQFIFWTGVSDIDDVFFNFLGTAIGYGLFALTQRFRAK